MKIFKDMTTQEKINKEDALDYAIEKVGITINEDSENEEQEEFKKMLVEWYFSGNYVEVEEEEC